MKGLWFIDSHFRKLYAYCKDANNALYISESTIWKRLFDFVTHTNALVTVNLFLWMW